MLAQLIQQCLEVNEFGEQRCKLLHCFCIISDISFIRRVFAAFIYAAETLEQLLQFTAFASTVVLHFPSAMLEGLKELVKRPNTYVSIAMLEGLKELVKRPNTYVSMFNDKSQRFQTFFNITNLLRWAKETADNSGLQTSMFGLRYDQFVDTISIAELGGLLVRFGVTSLAAFLENLEKMNEESFDKFVIAVEFITEISGAAPMESGISYTISRYLSVVYVHCLRLIDLNQTPRYGTAAVVKLDRMFKHVLCQKWKFSKNCFVSIFVKEVLMSSKELFGIGIDLSGLRDYFTDGTIDSSLLPNMKNLETSLLKEYRDTTVRNERARELVHSGIFKKKEKREHIISPLSSECMRAHFFFFTFQWLVMVPPEAPDCKEIIYDALALREVTNSIVDVLCADKHLTSYYHMGDWYEEKFFLSDHVEITRKLDTIPICYNLMGIIARAPYPTFFCIAPLITAELAVIVNRCELTLYKNDAMQKPMLDKIEKIFVLISKAQILTNIMPLIFAVICRCTMHECSSILIELWRILTLIRPTEEKNLNDLMSELNLRLHESPREIIPMPECPSLQLLKIMNLIVQRNAEKMQNLGYKIISLFPPEPEEDAWEQGPLFPVIAVNDPLKR
uniref:Integrator complex subunit 5 C-terminal domain-containing protein n=1 Tax=Panagrolaimus sp. ES5 TaxID=591445 RepID=A0AC34GPF7_9BILA